VGSNMAQQDIVTRVTRPSVASAERVLVVDSLVKQFGTPDGPVQARRGLVAVCKGALLSVIDPSGGGKSTVFNIIGGLQPEFQGRVTIQGGPICGPH
jgi:ABC-type nitrate/sulfonate/bicarbonate transport system ATPase subunit